MKKTLFLVISLIVVFTTASAQAYLEDFESGIAGSEWSTNPGSVPIVPVSTIGRLNTMGDSGSGSTETNAIGPFSGNGAGGGADTSLLLGLTGLGSGTNLITLTFDFYAVDSWDGTGTTPTLGPDQFGVSSDGGSSWLEEWELGTNELLSQTAGGNNYSAEIIQLWGVGNWNRTDKLFENMTVSFMHTGDSLDLTFKGWLLQGLGDESWLLDNVSVTSSGMGGGSSSSPVPEPSTVFLLGSGLLGLVGFKRKKQV